MLVLRQVREAEGISQQELARRSGVLQQTISKIEKGETLNPGVETLNALARAMGKKLGDIYRPDTDDEPDGKSDDVDGFNG